MIYEYIWISLRIFPLTLIFFVFGHVWFCSRLSSYLSSESWPFRHCRGWAPSHCMALKMDLSLVEHSHNFWTTFAPVYLVIWALWTHVAVCDSVYLQEGLGLCPLLCSLVLGSFIPAGLSHPTLIWEKVPSLAANWYSITEWCRWKASAFFFYLCKMSLYFYIL